MYFYCQQDERFNHDIDTLTGYRTRTLLCMPIKDFNGDVIGVAQVNVLGIEFTLRIHESAVGKMDYSCLGISE